MFPETFTSVERNCRYFQQEFNFFEHCIREKGAISNVFTGFPHDLFCQSIVEYFSLLHVSFVFRWNQIYNIKNASNLDFYKSLFFPYELGIFTFYLSFILRSFESIFMFLVVRFKFLQKIECHPGHTKQLMLSAKEQASRDSSEDVHLLEYFSSISWVKWLSSLCYRKTSVPYQIPTKDL